jgi:hypothetical protein
MGLHLVPILVARTSAQAACTSGNVSLVPILYLDPIQNENLETLCTQLGDTKRADLDITLGLGHSGKP